MTLIVFSTVTTLFGQENDSLQSERMDEMIQEMQMSQRQMQPKDVENFSSYFKPELIDTFFTYIQKEHYSKLYENCDDILKKMQSKDDLIKYFQMIRSIYGNLNSYKHETYSIKDQWMSMNKVASGNYTVEFDNAKAQVMVAFNIIDSASIKLQSLQIQTVDYSDFEQFKLLTEPTFKFLVSKDYPGLYRSTSDRFQDYTPISKYEEYIIQLDTVNFATHKLFRNQIGVVQGQELYYLTYDINSGEGYLTLTYTETNGIFLLEGLNYVPKE